MAIRKKLDCQNARGHQFLSLLYLYHFTLLSLSLSSRRLPISLFARTSDYHCMNCRNSTAKCRKCSDGFSRSDTLSTFTLILFFFLEKYKMMIDALMATLDFVVVGLVSSSLLCSIFELAVLSFYCSIVLLFYWFVYSAIGTLQLNSFASYVPKCFLLGKMPR
mgnify:CR=1 FL=1